MKLTDRQQLAQDVIAGPAQHCMLFGGSRSGKTFLLVRNVIFRALKAPSSRHAIFRFRYNHLKASIVLDTFPKVMRLAFPGVEWTPHHQDGYADIAGGSQIWFAGLDDKERTEKILGMEFATLYFNECSQIPANSIDTALTRLAQAPDRLREMPRQVHDLHRRVRPGGDGGQRHEPRHRGGREAQGGARMTFKRPPPRPAKQLGEGYTLRARPVAVASCEARMSVPVPKEGAIQHQGYMAAVRKLPCYRCGVVGFTQFCHRDEGKGMGTKTDCREGWPGCGPHHGEPGCHWLIGTSGRFLRCERRGFELEAGIATRATIHTAGLWPANLPEWAPDFNEAIA